MAGVKTPESKVALSLHDMLGADGAACCPSISLDRQVSQISTAASNGEEDGSGAPKKNFQPYHAQSVPKPENLEAHANVPAAGGVTTMMLRNIPNKYTQNTLLQEIDDLGFSGTYDFFYLPMDVHNRSNVGYAFINFLSPPDAERFRRIFSDHRFQRFQSRKISSVCTAHVQGLDANLRHFENRAVTHSRNDQYRPIVLKGNVRVDFEEAVAMAKGWSPRPRRRWRSRPSRRRAARASTRTRAAARALGSRRPSAICSRPASRSARRRLRRRPASAAPTRRRSCRRPTWAARPTATGVTSCSCFR